MLTNGPFGLSEREIMKRAAPATGGIVTVTVLGSVFESVNAGAGSGPCVSQAVTPAGTEKSSTTVPPAPPFDEEVASTPTPWLAKARQMMARFSPPVSSRSARRIESRESTKVGLHGE